MRPATGVQGSSMSRTDTVDVKRWRAKYALIERAAEADKDAQALFAELDSDRGAGWNQCLHRQGDRQWPAAAQRSPKLLGRGDAY